MNTVQRKYVSELGIVSLKYFKSRNIIAVIAIAMTTILFTVLAAIAFSVVQNFEQMNFLRIGTYCHGEFKNVTLDQINDLKDDDRISAFGLRRTIGVIDEGLLHGEVGYADQTSGKWSFIQFDEGGFPKEGTNEAAADTKLLDAIGVERKKGTAFTVTFTDLDGRTYTDTYVLSGWWERNELLGVSTLLITDSRINSYPEHSADPYNMAVMLKDRKNIEDTMHCILSEHDIPFGGENDTDIGVNWAYLGESTESVFDAGSVSAMILFILLIFLIGYLIIYSIFRISVSNDIRHYGMLKTIGASAKQIRLIVYTQALVLYAAGTLIGLVLGFAASLFLIPKMLQLIGAYYGATVSNPLIYVCSAVFTFLTVFISTIRPASMAAKVSPVEALRYTESGLNYKKERNSRGGSLLINMAWSNVWRSKSKTIITILSIALSIVLFHAAVIFVSGMDINSYVKNKIVSDMMIADSSLFQSEWDRSKKIDSDLIQDLDSLRDEINYGAAYLPNASVSGSFSAEDIETLYADHPDPAMREEILSQPDDSGCFTVPVKLYGMDRMCLENLTAIEGTPEKITGEGKYIAVLKDSRSGALPSCHLGDKIQLSFTEYPKIIDPATNQEYDSMENAPEGAEIIKGETHTTEYEVAFIAELPYAMSERVYSNINFAVLSEQLAAETGASGLYCMINVRNKERYDSIKEQITAMSANRAAVIDRDDTAKEYHSFRQMFIMLGMVLCIVSGLVGIINFFNTFFTGIITRKHEIAVLESIGMTKKQVIRMLMTEGMIHTFGSAVLTMLLCLILSPALGRLLEKLFWFFDYRSTWITAAIILPLFAVLGITIPVIIYKITMKGTFTEKLRTT